MSEVWTFAQLVHEVRARREPVRFVGVDGCGGAGKTTFAAQLSRAVGNCPVIHTDDFATHDDAFGWAARLATEVIEPLARGDSASYAPYDWLHRRDGATVNVPAADIVVIEGVGATRRALAPHLAIRIWVDAPRDVRLRRGIARDGEDLREFWRWWVQQEEAYVAAERPDLSADLVVHGDPPDRPSDGSFVVLSAPRAAGEAPA